MHRSMARFVRQAVAGEVQQDHPVAGLCERRRKRAIQVSVEQKAVQVHEKLRTGAVDLVGEPDALERELAVCYRRDRSQPESASSVNGRSLVSLIGAFSGSTAPRIPNEDHAY